MHNFFFVKLPMIDGDSNVDIGYSLSVNVNQKTSPDIFLCLFKLIFAIFYFSSPSKHFVMIDLSSVLKTSQIDVMYMESMNYGITYTFIFPVFIFIPFVKPDQMQFHTPMYVYSCIVRANWAKTNTFVQSYMNSL